MTKVFASIGTAVVAMLLAGSVYAAAQPGATAKPPQPGEGEGLKVLEDTPPETLMFSIDELTEIRNRMVQGAGANKNAAGRGDPIEDATLYLSTILYYGPEEWTFWLNGVAINPRQELKSIEVREITPNYVELLVPLSAQGMRPVRLSPNQTFITKSGAVVEGPTK
jgi:hypothetical protein